MNVVIGHTTHKRIKDIDVLRGPHRTYKGPDQDFSQ